MIRYEEGLVEIPSDAEKDIQRKIVQTLRAIGCVVIVVNHTAQAKRRTRGTTPGAPDLIVWFKGRAAALEVKRPGEHASEEQNEMLAAILREGGIAAVVTSPEEALEAVFGSSPKLTATKRHTPRG